MGGGSGPHHRPHVVFTMQECNASSIINIGSFMGGAQDLNIAPMWCFSVQCKNAAKAPSSSTLGAQFINVKFIIAPFPD